MEKKVLIVGSGPVGCTFARVLTKAGLNVTMIDAGASEKPPNDNNVAAHLKNNDIFQRNLDLFSGVIRSHLLPVSVPTRDKETTVDPGTFQYGLNFEATVQNGQNPDQIRAYNMGGAAVAYAVGGMGSHWTCATPRTQMELAGEYIQVLPKGHSRQENIDEMERLYREAEALVHTSSAEFNTSVRQKAILNALSAYGAKPLPLAAKRASSGRMFWSGPEVILKGGVSPGEDPAAKSITTDPAPGTFKLLPEHLCTELKYENGKIVSAKVTDLATRKTTEMPFDYFVIACGPILTPQLLWASGLRPKVDGEELPVRELAALGKYMCEQMMAFCQILLSQKIVDEIGNTTEAKTHKKNYKQDPVPIPFHDPEPNLFIPIPKEGTESPEREWHGQIHRDSFHYGAVPPNVDSRLVVDLRWFSTCDSRADNTMVFSGKNKAKTGWKNTDLFGMPQPTFRFRLSDKDRTRAHDMMTDMVRVAGTLGGFLPQSEPQFLDPGFALHMTGTARLADSENEGVVDRNSMAVFGVENLYLGGGSVIPTGIAVNTTLTMIALAVRAAERLATDAFSEVVTYQLAQHKKNSKDPEVKKEAMLEKTIKAGATTRKQTAAVK